MTDKEHNSMEEKIINNIDPIRRLHLGLYEEIQTIIGDEPNKKEENILVMIRERFGVE